MEKTTTFLVRYEQNQNTSFYLCRHCQTHLALHQELLHKYAANQQHALFRDLVNVGLGANYQIVTGQTGAPVCCINCGSNLGSKFVSLNIETSAIKDEALRLERKPDVVCRHRATSSECMNLSHFGSCF
ncbi:protein yippee-like At3g55890 isoform X1 [Salvia miltiorrhiza]|uniref:protein yippee-like At3g55890 isoform X1 n=1 Tax=Salvia miltiorrhiza TaxID=226208 RepID=UPI0025ABA370|nr:protein yippee-like At3g55890 isoform X1 [Salvia miltiorrhiza]XP_057808364.1 protein yippee-like At3g55890 isoform X1 [Salvia miltiorrhiza]